MTALAAWWQARTRREQRLLSIMLALIGAVALWLLVVRPLADADAQAQARHAAALDVLAEARAQEAAVERLERQRPPPLGAPLESWLARSLAEAGFTGTRIAAMPPGRAAVTIDAARPQAAFGWIDRAQAAGLVVDRFRASTNGDRTLAIEAVLRLRGR